MGGVALLREKGFPRNRWEAPPFTDPASRCGPRGPLERVPHG